MALPRYLRPIKDQKSYEPGPGERFVRALVFVPLCFLIAMPAAAGIVALFFGAVFFLPALTFNKPMLFAVLVALFIASVALSNYVFNRFVLS